MLEWVRTKIAVARLAWRDKWDVVAGLQRELDRCKLNAAWELQTKDAEIACLREQVDFLCNALQMEKSWVQMLTAQHTIQSVVQQQTR